VSGNFGRSAALGVVPLPKPQQALFGKQTWKYASGSKQTLRSAHPEGTEVTDLKLLRDGHSLLSRAADDMCKLWDIRKLREVVKEWDMPLSHSHSRLAVSPQEDLLLAGVGSTVMRLCHFERVMSATKCVECLSPCAEMNSA
jgi:WD40 repeat protein